MAICWVPVVNFWLKHFFFNSTHIDKQLLFPIQSPTFLGNGVCGGEGRVVGKCDSNENPKYDLDLD